MPRLKATTTETTIERKTVVELVLDDPPAPEPDSPADYADEESGVHNRLPRLATCRPGLALVRREPSEIERWRARRSA